MADVEETLKRIQSVKGVQGYLILNAQGNPIRNTCDNSDMLQCAGHLHQLVLMARSTVKDIDPENDLTFFRISTKKNEIMFGREDDCYLIVIQNISD